MYRILATVLIGASLAAGVLFGARVLGAGAYTTPEGTIIEVNSVGPWTTDQIYRMLRENGLDSRLGPTLTVKVQDVYSSQTSTSVQGAPGSYSNFKAIMYLKGTDSTFATMPDATLGHELGHAWTLYHLYVDRQGDWSSYLSFRGLAGDVRVDSTYAWSKNEMIADDYRLVLGSPAAKNEMPAYINSAATPPSVFPNFADFLLTSWAKPRVALTITATPRPTAAPLATPTSTPVASATNNPTPAVTATPTVAPVATAAPAPTGVTSSTAAPSKLLTNLTASPQSFRNSTKLSFKLSAPAGVTVSVFDATGASVRTLAATTYPTGTFSVMWDGTDASGARVRAANYKVQLVAVDATARSEALEILVSAR